MRAVAFTLIFTVVGVAISAAQNKPEPVAWTDSTRDVYINGEIDRSAQVLTSEPPERIALISPRLERAVVLDLSRRTVYTCSQDSFRFYPDRVLALSDSDLAVNHAGSYTLDRESDYSFGLDGRSVQITTHQALVGETERQALFEIVPVWRVGLESYQPDANAVAALRSSQPETAITVALATWCPDSKRHVPRLLKALDAAGNKHLHIKLIGIGRKFREPADTVKRLRIASVPTVIVERDGVEIGRIVENPKAKTMEEDLAAILNGAANKHE
jgi:thioredoxin 1